MIQPRSSLISLQDTPYYHCVSRCVRRAFLCGQDFYSGESYEHRREWIVERLALLAEIFCIEICAYAVMSNHYHVVLKVNKALSEQLTDQQVVERWQRLFKGPVLVQRAQQGLLEIEAERLAVAEIAGNISYLCKHKVVEAVIL